jgi:ferredoxin
MSAKTLLLMPLGRVMEVPEGATLLEAALSAGIRMSSSCRNGTCRACMCRLSAGEVRYRIEWPGLTAQEKAEGWILPCVALAVSDVEIIQPDAIEQTEPPTPRRSRGF